MNTYLQDQWQIHDVFPITSTYMNEEQLLTNDTQNLFTVQAKTIPFKKIS